MASKVGICNLALTRIGATNIISLDEDTKEARQCDKLYDSLRDEILSSYNWNFAMKRATLAQLSEVPDFEYLYQYQLPSDCLRAYEVFGSDGDYVIEGDRLLTDEEEVNLKYIASIEDTSLFSPSFVDVLSLKMAAELALALANDARLQQLMLQRYQLGILSAYRLNAIEGSPPELEELSLWQKAGR